MKHCLRFLLLGLLLLSQAGQARLRVFSCEPEWVALARMLGADRFQVFSATNAQQDVHYIQARPGLIARLRRADLLVCTGAGLEVGWLPVLLRRAANPRVRPGTLGYFEAASAITLLEKPQRLDRAEGDIHPEGNPHIQLDPHNILAVARALGQRLQRLDSTHAQDYRQALAAFEQRWQRAMADWEKRAAALRGLPIVVHHDGWIYLERWLGLKQIGSLEPKPGVPPTSAHLSRLLTQLKTTPAAVIIRAPFQDPRPAQWLHRKTGIPVRVLPFTVGGNPDARDLFGLFDSTLAQLEAVAR